MTYSQNDLLDSLKLTFKSQTTIILLAVVFIMTTANHSLFNGIFKLYPPTLLNLPFLTSLTLFFSSVTAILFLLICHGKWTKWILAAFLIVSSVSAYYMDNFGVIIDTVMIDNIIQTNRAELSGLITADLIMRLCVFGAIPAWLILKYSPDPKEFKTELSSRLKAIALLLVTIVAVIIPFTSGYATFIREHRIVRFYANPTYSVYSAIKLMQQQLSMAENIAIKTIAPDAKLSEAHSSKKELVILVVGETARFDRFSLNGYKRETNPRLAKQGVVSFANVASCGTSTGVSVPCMFSSLGQDGYDKKTALQQENVLDILSRSGVEVLWRDNNSDSKGVATRIKYEDFKSPTLNPVCEGECRDIGMLDGLDRYIEAHHNQDMLIVLHQMGNHGPEYYRRYPKNFERYKPACQTGELRDCSQQEIDNAYDNAILYTDYFLSEVINFLKRYDQSHEVAMLYIADHGESLGERGVYLHAAPYIIAPKEQTHIPAILWTGQHFEYQLDNIRPYRDAALSHDDLFCSLFITYEVESGMCATKQNNLNLNVKKITYASIEQAAPKKILD